jgi:hypothetical protein
VYVDKLCEALPALCSPACAGASPSRVEPIAFLIPALSALAAEDKARAPPWALRDLSD